MAQERQYRTPGIDPGGKRDGEAHAGFGGTGRPGKPGPGTNRIKADGKTRAGPGRTGRPGKPDPGTDRAKATEKTRAKIGRTETDRENLSRLFKEFFSEGHRTTPRGVFPARLIRAWAVNFGSPGRALGGTGT